MKFYPIALALGFGFAHVVNACPSVAREMPEPDRTANLVRDKLFSHCGNSYFYAGSAFDASGPTGGLDPAQTPKILEFQDPVFNLVSITVTPAEKANGVQYHGRWTMIAKMYRAGGEPWQDGPALQPRNTQDIAMTAQRNARGDEGQMANSGAVALDILQQNGKWSVARGSLLLSGGIPGRTVWQDIQDFLATKTLKVDCARGPAALQDELEKAAREAEDARLTPEERAFQEKIRRNREAIRRQTSP
jgi:hypothetical protein